MKPNMPAATASPPPAMPESPRRRILYLDPQRGPVEVLNIRMAPGVYGNCGFFTCTVAGHSEELSVHRDSLRVEQTP